MSISTISNPTFLHANQIDALYTIYNSTQIKAFFDSQATGIISDVNTKIVGVLNNTTLGTSGTENIGSPTIPGVFGNTAYSQINDLKSQITSVVLGQIPDRSLPNTKIQLGTLTNAEIALNTLLDSNVNPLYSQLNQNRILSMGGMM